MKILSVAPLAGPGLDRLRALGKLEVDPWDAHVPMLRHRDAWAEERRSPSAAEWGREQREAERKERRRADRRRRESSS